MGIFVLSKDQTFRIQFSHTFNKNLRKLDQMFGVIILLILIFSSNV
jgi:hypothetical protein